MALLWNTTYNLRHPMHLRHPVRYTLASLPILVTHTHTHVCVGVQETHTSITTVAFCPLYQRQLCLFKHTHLLSEGKTATTPSITTF